MKLFLASLLIFQSQALTNSSSDYVSARLDGRLDDFTDIFPDDVECTLANGNVLNAGKNWGNIHNRTKNLAGAFVVRIIKILLLLKRRESRNLMTSQLLFQPLLYKYCETLSFNLALNLHHSSSFKLNRFFSGKKKTNFKNRFKRV